MQHTSTQAGPKISFSSAESASTYSTESSNYDGCLPLTINGVNIMKEDISVERQQAIDFDGEMFDSVFDKKYKFSEGKSLKELRQYVDSTYDSHYSKNKYQATEFILDSGHGTGFCMGNILKYAQRYQKKGNGDESRKDLMKILHYALIQLHIHDEILYK